MTKLTQLAERSDNNGVRLVMYLHSHAFTKCDCGKDLVMYKSLYGDATYKGKCECGKTMILRNGRMRELQA